MNTMSLKDALDAAEARKANGPWFPASGGTEQPFSCRGYRLLYMYQPSSGRHAYLDLGTDLFLSDAEAARILGVV